MKRMRDNQGFTLMEVMVALAILGLSLVVLLESHYASLTLYTQAEDEVTFRNLLQRAAGEAEMNVMTGELSDGGDFGDRYPDFAWSYDAYIAGEDDTILLYDVRVMVTGPNDTERELSFRVFDPRYE